MQENTYKYADIFILRCHNITNIIDLSVDAIALHNSRSEAKTL